MDAMENARTGNQTKRPVIAGNREALFFQRLNLFDERVDFFRSQFAGELGHVAFAVGDHIAQIIGGSGSGFCGVERWTSEMTAFGGFSMTLRTIFHIDRI